MKFAIISLGGKSTPLILKEAKYYFKEADFLNIKDIEVHADTKELGVLYKGEPMKKYDCIYVRGSFKYALLQRSLTRALHHETYMPLSPESFTFGHNKFLTLLELQKNKIPLPKTYLAATAKSAKKILEEVHYPIIIKIPLGTHGKGVMFADSVNSAKSIIDNLEVSKQPYIIQEYIETDATDIRAVIAGNKVLAAMERKAPTEELRANIHLGAKGKSCTLDYDTKQIAIKTAKALGADLCAVDILKAEKKSYVIELNLSPGLAGITKATKKNIAKEIAKFLYEKTKEFQKLKKSAGYGEIIKEIELKAKHENEKEILTSLTIKEGIIKLPKVITDITEFTPDDEVIILSKKGKITIKKHKIT